MELTASPLFLVDHPLPPPNPLARRFPVKHNTPLLLCLSDKQVKNHPWFFIHVANTTTPPSKPDANHHPYPSPPRSCSLSKRNKPKQPLVSSKPATQHTIIPHDHLTPPYTLTLSIPLPPYCSHENNQDHHHPVAIPITIPLFLFLSFARRKQHKPTTLRFVKQNPVKKHPTCCL